MIDPVKNSMNIPGLQRPVGPAGNELRTERAQDPQAQRQGGAQQQGGPASPLEGISEQTLENAYTYRPQKAREPGAAMGPMRRMRLWNQAISNLLTGNTSAESSPLHMNLVRAGNGERGALAGMGAVQRPLADEGASAKGPSTGCETCAGRKYQDGSGDAGVSFQTPTGVPASTAGLRVASHEGEHATRETAKAQEEGAVITGKKVTFQYGCCPECNKMYIKGGRTSITKQSGGEGGAVASRLADVLGGVGERLSSQM